MSAAEFSQIRHAIQLLRCSACTVCDIAKKFRTAIAFDADRANIAALVGGFSLAVAGFPGVRRVHMGNIQATGYETETE